MTFSDALISIKAGNRLSRIGWDGTNMWIALQIPDRNSKMTLPYIYMSTIKGDLVPWIATQTDSLVKDWHGATGEWTTI